MRKKDRLHRNTTDGWIGGVCEGLGEYFDIDPTWLRLIAVFGLLAGAATGVAYIVLWIVLPDNW